MKTPTYARYLTSWMEKSVVDNQWLDQFEEEKW